MTTPPTVPESPCGMGPSDLDAGLGAEPSGPTMIGRVAQAAREAWASQPGYGDARRLERPWRGCVVKTITHPHFGPSPVEVFAINVTA